MVEETGKVTEIVIDEEQAGQRLDKFLAAYLPKTSRSQLQKWIVEGRVKVDGELCRVGHSLRKGAIITIVASDKSEQTPVAQVRTLAPRPVDFEILFEDEYLLVINKPAGLVVHPGAGTHDPTLVEGVMHYLTGEEEPDGNDGRPGVVHRLDKDTTGVMVLAKDVVTHEQLALQFKEKSNLREYVALVDGVIGRGETTFESYLYRDPKNRLRYASLPPDKYNELVASGKDTSGYRYAKTVFSPRKIYGNRLSLLTVRLYTGRTHQIRVHTKALGLAICGDQIYGSNRDLPKLVFPAELIQEIKLLKRQMLHARLLGFKHPHSGKKLAFEAALPADFKNIIQLLEKYVIEN